MKTVLTIAGSDSIGGAGIQADLKTILAHGMYGMSVITAITAQNTKGVQEIESVSPWMVEKQLEAVLSDILPHGVKIGLLPSPETVEVVARLLKKYSPRFIVLDPVLAPTQGLAFSGADTMDAMKTFLFPLVKVLTPNCEEAKELSHLPVSTKEEQEAAGRALLQWGSESVLVKGGHSKGGADDVLLQREGTRWFLGERIPNPNTHGTGCTLSSSIACHLANHVGLEESVALAKEYLTKAIAYGLDLGKGRGPLHHGIGTFRIEKEEMKFQKKPEK